VWRRVDVSPLGATFVLAAAAAGGFAHVLDTGGVSISAGEIDAFAVVTVTPDTVVYAKARARGVSLLLGVRDAGAASGARVTYVRHVAGGAVPSAALFLLHGLVPPVHSARAGRYSYMLPHASTECAQYGVATASAVVASAQRAHTTGVFGVEEPLTGELALPHDAQQVLSFIARDLQEGGEAPGQHSELV